MLRLDRRCASFETAASQPPQDEDLFSMPSRTFLMLRSAPRAHLEARTTPGQLPQPSASAGRGACRLFGGLQPLLRPRFRPRFDRRLANRRLLDETGVAEEACDPISRQ